MTDRQHPRIIGAITRQMIDAAGPGTIEVVVNEAVTAGEWIAIAVEGASDPWIMQARTAATIDRIGVRIDGGQVSGRPFWRGEHSDTTL